MINKRKNVFRGEDKKCWEFNAEVNNFQSLKKYYFYVLI